MEIWKDIEGYIYYQVSNLGRIRSLDREVLHRGFYVKRDGKILKSRLDKYGYLRVNIYLDGKIKVVKNHRITLKTFKPNPLNKPTVNHINGIKTDNKIENLEWATHSENTQHAFDIGLMENSYKKRRKN